jgi:hypothetical protein
MPMLEQTVDQIEEDEISDEAVEAAGTRAEMWTLICTGIQCNSGLQQ